MSLQSPAVRRVGNACFRPFMGRRLLAFHVEMRLQFFVPCRMSAALCLSMLWILIGVSRLCVAARPIMLKYAFCYPLLPPAAVRDAPVYHRPRRLLLCYDLLNPSFLSCILCILLMSPCSYPIISVSPFLDSILSLVLAFASSIHLDVSPLASFSLTTPLSTSPAKPTKLCLLSAFSKTHSLRFLSSRSSAS
jgi:hypothetical protein